MAARTPEGRSELTQKVSDTTIELNEWPRVKAIKCWGVTIQSSLVSHIHGSRVAQLVERTRDVHICKDVEL